jgi:hypothetical protein
MMVFASLLGCIAFLHFASLREAKQSGGHSILVGKYGGHSPRSLVAWPPNPHCLPLAGSAGKAANGRLLARLRRVCIVPKGPANASDGAKLGGYSPQGEGPN